MTADSTKQIYKRRTLASHRLANGLQKVLNGWWKVSKAKPPVRLFNRLIDLTNEAHLLAKLIEEDSQIIPDVPVDLSQIRETKHKGTFNFHIWPR
jgi:hypothetical protein